MSASSIKVLLVEDNPGDARLIEEFLRYAEGATFELDCADRLSEGLKHIEGKDAILLDLALPDSAGLDTFRKMRSQAPALPIIVLTGTDDNSLAFEAIHEGAQDYLVKGQINGQLLARSIRYAIERKSVDEALKSEILKHKQLEAELSEAKEELEIANEELRVELEEHQKLEEKLVKAKEAAEAAVEAKQAFLANMSHELRTPLNAVIGFSSLLLEDNLTKDQKDNIESIRNGGEVLLSIISDILELSKSEKDKITLEHQPLSLKHCIEESMDMVAIHAKQKGLNLAYTISYGTPDTIIGDPGRLRQVLVNLLSNAVKFTDVGDISVSVSSKAIEGNKRKMTFSVKDTGIGMPKDKIDSLFQPFTQLEYTLSRKRDGAGLGLAISKKLVELMGGKIWAESEEGKGSIFRFTIPVETIPGKQLDLDKKDKIAGYEDLSSQKPLSILVAEDNPSNQRVLVEMLKRLGYRADAVADGVEVLQALKIRPYDLIFMDIKMPEMDGLTAIKEIRKLWPDNRPKVVAITAFAMDGDREKCLEAGADEYIAKPVKVDDLAIILRNITPLPRIKYKK
ncbi:MAG: response regulator [Methanotrichaceae archaeon]